jgi:hypothetical protein
VTLEEFTIHAVTAADQPFSLWGQIMAFSKSEGCKESAPTYYSQWAVMRFGMSIAIRRLRMPEQGRYFRSIRKDACFIRSDSPLTSEVAIAPPIRIRSCKLCGNHRACCDDMNDGSSHML